MVHVHYTFQNGWVYPVEILYGGSSWPKKVLTDHTFLLILLSLTVPILNVIFAFHSDR